MCVQLPNFNALSAVSLLAAVMRLARGFCSFCTCIIPEAIKRDESLEALYLFSCAAMICCYFCCGVEIAASSAAAETSAYIKTMILAIF